MRATARGPRSPWTWDTACSATRGCSSASRAARGSRRRSSGRGSNFRPWMRCTSRASWRARPRSCRAHSTPSGSRRIRGSTSGCAVTGGSRASARARCSPRRSRSPTSWVIRTRSDSSRARMEGSG